MTALRHRAGRLHGDVVLGGAALALCTSIVLDPDAVASGPVVCPFRLATGLPCPACGSVRTWTAVMHGRWSDAWALNPFALLVLGAAVVLLVWRVASLVTRRIVAPDLERLLRSRVVHALLGAWILWWIWRLVA